MRDRQREVLAGGRPHRRKDVRGGKPFVAQAWCTLAPEPAVRHLAFLADARLILKPERKALVGMGGRGFFYGCKQAPLS
jgi:hypothetical protein